MCGIAGAFGAGVSGSVAERMTDALAHRGPDDFGHLTLESRGALAVHLCHRRLSILDLSCAGHQPMRRGSLALVFNGEIYNYAELRRELSAAGAVFESNSDTEVILAGWQAHGPAFVDRLRGMYAFAIWDESTATAFLARDPFGIKPLYVAERDGVLLFASEVRALLASGLVEPRIDREALHGYLEFGSSHGLPTLVAGIAALDPGAVESFRIVNGAVSARERRYTARLAGSAERRERDPVRAAAHLREVLRDSVAHHLVSDVPVGLFLSGGIDSSAIVGLAAEASGATLDTFNIGFREKSFDESRFARAVAERFRTRHHEIEISGEEMLASLPAALAAMDQPSMDGLNTYVVSRAVREAGLKVVLSGLGGDELFAGYPSFRRAAAIARPWRASALPRRVAAGVLSGSRNPIVDRVGALLGEESPARAAYVGSRMLFPPGLRARLLGAPRAGRRHSLAPSSVATSVLHEVSRHELAGYMRDVLLRDSDVFSMSHGLELRVPFVDKEVLRAVLEIDDSLLLRRGRMKPLLVDAVEDLLPREVWDRPKQGFVMPFDRWMRGPLEQEVSEALSSASRLERVGLSPAATREVWNGFTARRRGFEWSRPWSLYTLIRWAENVGVSVAEGGELEAASAYAAPLPA